MDQSRALSLAAEGLDLWQSGDLAEAEERYRKALAVAEPRHHRTPDIHAHYAGLLMSLRRLADAGPHYEKALQLELQNDRNETAPAVVAARYMLGEYYLAMGEPESARRVVAPSLDGAQQPLAWLVEAVALAQAGADDEARAAATRAISLASDADQKDRIRSRLSECLGGPDGGR
jgi:tetratricopeptide (TPR) repeat protein